LPALGIDAYPGDLKLDCAVNAAALTQRTPR
jgi:hypothetical protein